VLTLGQNNFHPSQNFFLAAGKHIKATDMIRPVVEQLIRLQRGIQAFDATTGRKIVICGGLVMGTGDNPAASDLCAHTWRSNRPCRVCLFNKKNVSSYIHIHQLGATRSLAGTKNATSTEREELGMKKDLTDFYKLPGVNPHLDWTYDVLHGALLGYVKYLWKATINDSEVKKDLGALALLQETNNDDFTHRLNSKQIVSWNGSFVGKDFKYLIQAWPLTLIAFYGRSNDVSESIRRITRLWGLAGALTVLLYQTEITDIDAWSDSISKTSLGLIELWSAQWGLDDLKNKTKIHHLAHLGMWAKRFGPTIVGSAETNEAANKRMRRHLSLSNRQAGSRDLANKLATAQGIQFLAQEGIWKTDKDAVTMTRPGSALRELCRVPEVRDLVGLPTPESQAKADVLFLIRKNNVPQSIRGHLLKGTYGLDCVEQSEYFLFSQFRLADARLGLGKISSFVSTGETILRVACILRESRSGIGYLVAEVFEEVSIPGGLEEQIRRYRSGKKYKLLQPSAVQTLLNAQHACRPGCRVQENHRNAFQREREWISGDKWVHAENVDEWIINPYVLR
jgi:hypothetical protein